MQGVDTLIDTPGTMFVFSFARRISCYRTSVLLQTPGYAAVPEQAFKVRSQGFGGGALHSDAVADASEDPAVVSRRLPEEPEVVEQVERHGRGH